MNIFDRAKRVAYNVVDKTMGYDARWQNEAGVTITDRVLFNEPTELTEFSGAEFAPLNFFIEYRVGRFPGLFELVREGYPQSVEIRGRWFVTRQATSSIDGENYIIYLEPQSL